MRAVPLISLLVALLSLGVGVVALTSTPPPPPPAPVAARPSDELLELRKRVELLEDDTRALWDRVTVLERRGLIITDGGTDPSLAAEVARLREQVNALAASRPGESAANRAALADLVRQISDEQQRERNADRLQRLQNRSTEYAQRWRSFAGEAGLTPTAEQTLTERMAAEEQIQRSVFEKGDGMPSPDGMRQLSQARRDTDKAMREQLDERQFELYLNVRREQTGGRLRGR